MRNIKAEINRRLTNFLFHISGFVQNFFDDLKQFAFDLVGLDISEECWQGLLKEFKNRNIVLENRIFEALNHEL